MSNEHAHDDHGLSHVMPLKGLLAVFIALLVLTGITVALAKGIELGRWDLTVAMTIATIKAAIVALYFMHLRYDKALNIVIFVSSIVFAIIFLGFSALDATTYQDRIEAWEQEQLDDGN